MTTVTTVDYHVPVPEQAPPAVPAERLIENIRARAVERYHAWVRAARSAGRALHAEQIRDLADAMVLLLRQGEKPAAAVKAVAAWFAEIRSANLDPATADIPPTPRRVLVGGVPYTDTPALAPDIAKLLRRWLDLARWQAGPAFFRSGEAKEYGLVTVGGDSFALPVNALAAGHGLAAVHTAFLQAIRPPRPTDLDAVPEKLTAAAKAAVANLRVTVRVKSEGAPGGARRKSIRVFDPSEPRRSATLAKGIILGLLPVLDATGREAISRALAENPNP